MDFILWNEILAFCYYSNNTLYTELFSPENSAFISETHTYMYPIYWKCLNQVKNTKNTCVYLHHACKCTCRQPHACKHITSVSLSSLIIPRPSHLQFLLLAVCNMEGGGLGNLIMWSVAQLMSRTLDSTAYWHFYPWLENLNKFQRRGKAEEWLCYEWCNYTPRDACHCWVFSRLPFSRLLESWL